MNLQNCLVSAIGQGSMPKFAKAGGGRLPRWAERLSGDGIVNEVAALIDVSNARDVGAGRSKAVPSCTIPSPSASWANASYGSERSPPHRPLLMDIVPHDTANQGSFIRFDMPLQMKQNKIPTAQRSDYE